MTWLQIRTDNEEINYISPQKEVNAGLWALFAGATVLLFLRIWVKRVRRHGLWYDDYILIASWLVLLMNDALISYEYATGYVVKNGADWDDRMHILITISSCGTLIGQAWSKTAFGVTLLKFTERWQQYILWFCIITMNAYMMAKIFLQWGKLCGSKSYDVWYRLNFCVNKKFRDDFKEGGNVYNVIMDFVFALFPWMITWKLEMRKKEKIGLCLTMSLGVVVAIVAAIRISWKDEGNEKDALYYWRNGMSNIWYSSEVAGTIMVQCIPVLRPFLRDIHASLTSKRLPSRIGEPRYSFTWGSRNRFSKQPSPPAELRLNPYAIDGLNFGFNETKVTAGIELNDVAEEEMDEEQSLRGKAF